MKQLKQLIKELKELKNQGVNEAYINDIKNLLIDYWNETQNRDFDDFINEFVDEEGVLNAVQYWASRGDLWQVKYLVENLEGGDYRKDNGDYFENIDAEDVEDRLDEIIDKAKDLLNKNKKDAGAK